MFVVFKLSEKNESVGSKKSFCYRLI